MTTDSHPGPWRKAAASGANGTCVQMRRNGGSVEIRDSKDPDGATLKFTTAEIASLLDGVKNQEFDDLAI